MGIAVLLMLVGAMLALCGCPDPNGSDAWYDEVKNILVVAHSYDWDADPDDDGIRVWINLLDMNEDTVTYAGQEMTARIEIYSTESQTYPWEPGRLIYSGTTVLRNWQDDAFVTGAIGVKDIAWQDIDDPLSAERQEHGIMYASVTLPDDREVAGRYYPCRIREG